MIPQPKYAIGDTCREQNVIDGERTFLAYGYANNDYPPPFYITLAECRAAEAKAWPCAEERP